MEVAMAAATTTMAFAAAPLPFGGLRRASTVRASSSFSAATGPLQLLNLRFTDLCAFRSVLSPCESRLLRCFGSDGSFSLSVPPAAFCNLCGSRSPLSSRESTSFRRFGSGHSSPSSVPSAACSNLCSSRFAISPCESRLFRCSGSDDCSSSSVPPAAFGNLCGSPSSLSPRESRLFRCSGSDESSSSSVPPAAAPSQPSLEGESQEEGEVGSSVGILKELQQRPRARREADSTDWITSSLTRRFGLAGGLAWVGFLAFGVISEQIKTRTEVFLETQGTEDVDEAKEVVLDNDVKYVDVRRGGGSSPLRGDLVLLDLTGRVRSTGQVFVDTTSGSKRPLAFVYGLKPYARGVCYGLEYALQSMKAGGKRKVMVPASQCFGGAGADIGDGVVVPGGADIEYEVQLQRVSIAPS